MYPEFPIECECSYRPPRFNLAFARKALEVLRPGHDVAAEASPRGLTLLAETEMALEEPLSVLRDMYGNNIQVGPPKVRYRQNAEQLEEPYMGLRIRCRPAYFTRLRIDLVRRGADISDAELTSLCGVLRATAPLAVLVGYPAHVRTVTEGTAQLVMWLSHYAPVTNTPPGGNAA
jgi:predicted membrane GTPase involved in stress response